MKIIRKGKIKAHLIIITLALISLGFLQCIQPESSVLELKEDFSIVLIGNNLGSRMMYFGHFETEMHLRYPGYSLFIRNMSDPGNTPGFRPHSSRNSPWAFPGAENFQTELAANSGSDGHIPTPDEWLTKLSADIIIAFFGFNESFQGEAGLENYKTELDVFVRHTLCQQYS